MGTYSLEKVLKMWELEQLTTEQAIGQLLLLLQALSERVADLEREMWRERQAKASTPRAADITPVADDPPSRPQTCVDPED